jgi:hypothetical protein
MTAHRLSFAVSLLCVFLLQSVVGVASADCPVEKKTHKLKFKTKGDQCVAKVVKSSDDADASSVDVCEGDTVTWSVSGAKKSVVFDGVSPFAEWTDSGFQGSKIEGTVKAGAAKDGQKTAYKYSVAVDGQPCVLDPQIIVDRRR